MLEDHLNKSFSLPIDFCSNTYVTPKNLFEDLELVETHKDVSNVTLYGHLLILKLHLDILLWKNGAKNTLPISHS